MENKMGRPPIGLKPMGRVLQIRLADNEQAEYERAAERAGMTVSAWIRDRLAKAVKREAKRG